MNRQEQIKMAADKYCKDEWTHLGFVAGAEWADLTMIEKACEWLRGRLPLTNLDEFINKFKKAMKNEG